MKTKFLSFRHGLYFSSKKKKSKNSKWSVDLVIAPENSHGEKILKDAKKWMGQKYGAKKSCFIKLK